MVKNKKSFVATLSLFLFLLLITSANFYFHSLDANFRSVWLSTFSLSAGDRYYGRLELFRWYLEHGQLDKARQLDSSLDSPNIAWLKSQYYPEDLYQQLAALSSQADPSADNLIQIAQLQLKLNQREAAVAAVKKAYQLDPLRSDIEKLYYQLVASPTP